jgi:hypothetical protein
MRLPTKRQFLRTALWIYIGLIWTWFALRLAFFDRVWWLSLLNTYAFYFLIPSLIFLPIALSRHKQTTSKFATIGLTLRGLL